MKHLYLIILSIVTILRLHGSDSQQYLLFNLMKSKDPIKSLTELNHKNFNINAHIDYYENTILHYASGYLNNISLVKALLLHNANIDPKNSINGETPLHQAAYCGHSEVIKILLEFGADKNSRTYKEKTPSDLARDEGHIAIAEIIDNWENPLQLKEPDTL